MLNMHYIFQHRPSIFYMIEVITVVEYTHADPQANDLLQRFKLCKGFSVFMGLESPFQNDWIHQHDQNCLLIIIFLQSQN